MCNRWFSTMVTGGIAAIALALLPPLAYGATCDGYVYLQNGSCHAATRISMDGLLDRTDWCDDAGYYGPFTLVLPGVHAFKYTHPGFYPETHSFQVNLIGNTRLPEVTLENCALCNPSSWQVYPYTIPGTDIRFPRDDGKHMPFAEFPVEWWYGNFHLTSTSTGHEYVIWAAFFKFPQMVLMSVTDLQTGVTYSADRYPLTFSAAETHLDISASLPPFTDRWYNEVCGGGLHPFEYWMDMSFLSEGVVDGWLHMRSVKKPIAVGGDGRIEIGSGFSYYYSQTRMDVWGVLHLPGGPALGEEMHGVGWMDHQWGNIPTEAVSWEWLSIQLDDNREIMVADVWVDGIEQGSFSGGLNYVGASCNQEVWPNYEMTPLAFWTDPQSGREFAVKWRVTLNEPTRQVDLVVDRRIDQSVMRLGIFDLLPLCFWEGPCTVSGTINGQSVSGTAFAEVTHPQTCSVGTCCLGEHGCVLMTAGECTAQGGQFGGLCTLCAPGDPCDQGVCCTEPYRAELLPCHPSPATGVTSLRFTLAQAGRVRIELYDAAGRAVRLLRDGPVAAGPGAVDWDGRDHAGNPVAPGMYFCRMAVDGQVMTQRVLQLH
jgi:predicted secreted hydrolase